MATAKDVLDVVSEQRKKLCELIDYKQTFEAIRSVCNEYDNSLKLYLSWTLSEIYKDEELSTFNSKVVEKFKNILERCGGIPSLAIQNLFSAWYYGTKNITCTINTKLKKAGKKCIDIEELDTYVSSIENINTERLMKNGVITKALMDLKILALNAGNFINSETRCNVLYRLAASDVTRLIIRLGNRKFKKESIDEEGVTKEDRILYLYIEHLLLEIERSI